ncbi:hypothetical protein LZZ85_05610 [Terrimonas sp. NA20]|uniref:Uncharacterized protein n=1 Tax=Terrimonas ginsenosidimutans TaxID=2908004 RepID=A0ABS9KN51_9BACT|nr:hypothetical protein [Terrimonas ginsenosidimutans]MCG2613744.1 hypothetical protein [Terrimonas ginsenosidimutans]
MANSTNSIITGKFRGMLGKEVVFREWDGKTIVAKAPRPRKGSPTPEQIEQQDRFLIASKYAKAVTDNPDQAMAEAYATALRPRQNVYSRALEDCLKAPVVKKISTNLYTGNAGDKITIRAVDDYRVVTVWVQIFAANGSLLERGAAVQNTNGLDWSYTTTQANNSLAGTKIIALATDVPGNEGSLEVIV